MEQALTASGDKADAEKVRRKRRHDPDAFAGLVAEHGPDVLRLCMVITGDRASAQDAAQNTWQQAWRHLDALRDERRVRGWLLRIAANEARQQLRSRRRDAEHSTRMPAETVDTISAPDPDLRAAIERLSDEERQLLAYRYALGLNSTEIASQLGLSSEGVRTRLMRLRDRLRRDLEHE